LLGSTPTPFASRESAKRFFEENYRHDPLTGGFLHANLEPKPDGRLDWRFHAPGMIETIEAGRATDATEELHALTLPTLLIRGGRSEELPAEEAARMTGLRPSIKFIEIPDAGHFVHAEKPGEFSGALKEFLAGI
jgi:esterase